jgi:hypothetical protein
LFRQFLRRNRFDPRQCELIQAAQIDAQAIGREFRDFLSLHGERGKYNAELTNLKVTRLRLKTYLRDNPPR